MGKKAERKRGAASARKRPAGHGQVRQAAAGLIAKAFRPAGLPGAGPAQAQARPDWRLALHQAEALRKQGDLAKALDLVEPLAKRMPEQGALQNFYALLLAGHRRYEEAFAVWQQLVQADPHAVGPWCNMGLGYTHTGQFDLAQAALQRALALVPEHKDSLLNMGHLLQKMGKGKEAMAYYDRLLALEPGNVQTLFNYARIYEHGLDFARAAQWYQKILEHEPGRHDAMANLFFTLHYLMPQPVERIAQLARSVGLDLERTVTPLPPVPRRALGAGAPPLRIGLVSADLRDHPVGYFIEGLLHAPAAQEVTWLAYANTADKSALTQRIEGRFASWHRVDTWSNETLAQQVRADGVDVLVDLSGHTRGGRIGLFAFQAAPLQLTWLGYFGTTGLGRMNAVLADPYCVPPEEEGWFTERVWRLPHTRFCFTPPRDAPQVTDLPALRHGFIRFGCFQELAKINDSVLQLWGQIAQAVPTARWRLQTARLAPDGADASAFRQRLAQAGFAPEQVELHGAVPRAQYLAAVGEVDLILDTFAYPGGTTTTEALWMGVPTLSLPQPGMLGRQGQQILQAAGLADWICHSPEDYLRRAQDWAQAENWPKLAQLRQSLRAQVSASPLFDNARFAQDWVALVRRIWESAD